MKILKVKEYAVQSGLEWQATSYPGDGAYLVPSGNLIIMRNGIISQIQGGSAMLEDTAQGGGSAVDVHRLIEQLKVPDVLALALESARLALLPKPPTA